MSKQKHAPGPWTGGYEAINDKYGRLLANVYFKGISGDIPVAEGRANSALIAAAPEMLGALKEMVQFYEMLGTTGEFKARVDALIAKAEGCNE